MNAGPDALQRASDAGVSGVLITDLPVGADPEREAWLGSSPLAYVRLVAPTTPATRMAEIGRNGSGFVYLISRLGVTGATDSIAGDLPETVARLRGVTSLPICVGVVVGSAVVKLAEASVDAALALVRDLRAGLDSAGV
jgi:tryptophan synthase alpha chain